MVKKEERTRKELGKELEKNWKRTAKELQKNVMLRSMSASVYWSGNIIIEISHAKHKCHHSLVVMVADCGAKGQWFNPGHLKTEFKCCGCGKLF